VALEYRSANFSTIRC